MDLKPVLNPRKRNNKEFTAKDIIDLPLTSRRYTKTSPAIVIITCWVSFQESSSPEKPNQPPPPNHPLPRSPPPPSAASLFFISSSHLLNASFFPSRAFSKALRAASLEFTSPFPLPPNRQTNLPLDWCLLPICRHW
eukprot:Gb_16987 [translate_table: standard]